MVSYQLHNIDLDTLETRYAELLIMVKTFLHNQDLPTTKSTFISYISICSRNEVDLILLRSDLSLARAEMDHDYKVVYHRTFRMSHDEGQKWIADITIGMDPEITDLKMKLDKLDSMIGIIDELKWSIKASRDLAKENVFHLNS